MIGQSLIIQIIENSECCFNQQIHPHYFRLYGKYTYLLIEGSDPDILSVER